MEKYHLGNPSRWEIESPSWTEQMAMTNGERLMTMTVMCRCGKICNNSCDLKIHQARKKCLEGNGIPQHTDSSSEEAPHRAQSLHVAELVLPNFSLDKVRLKWLQACKTMVWEQFDEDVNKVLEVTAGGDVD